MKTKRAFLIAPVKFELREMDINPGPGQILVKVAACGVCNWEMNHWKGLLGECPQTLGHEWGGTVAALGEGITDIAVGDGVTGFAVDGLTGFSEYVVSSAGNYFKLAPHVKPEHALGEPLQCITNVLRATSPDYGTPSTEVNIRQMQNKAIELRVATPSFNATKRRYGLEKYIPENIPKGAFIDWEWGNIEVSEHYKNITRVLHYALEDAEAVEDIEAYPMPDILEPYCWSHIKGLVKDLHNRNLAAMGCMSQTICEEQDEAYQRIHEICQ